MVADEEAHLITQDIHGMSKELSDTQKKQLRDLIQECKDVVTTTLGFSSAIEHKIDTKDHIPIKILPYRLRSCLERPIEGGD